MTARVLVNDDLGINTALLPSTLRTRSLDYFQSCLLLLLLLRYNIYSKYGWIVASILHTGADVLHTDGDDDGDSGLEDGLTHSDHITN
jgi:hypothetical protein